MKHFFHSIHPLTDPADRLGILLILLLFLMFPFRALSADNTSSPIFSNPIQQYNSAIEQGMADERRMAVLNWMRNRTIGLVPGLPDDVREPVNWVIGAFHNSNGFLSFGLSTLADENDPAPVFAAPQFAPSPLPESGSDSWLASTAYHHHNGFVPTRDALVAGAHAKQNLFDQYLQYDLHPYAGQNYFTQRNYYGGDLSFEFAKPSNTADASRPWGKIVFSYANGDDRLTDYGRGIDMHGELHFSDNLSLNSGMRQSNTSGTDNYVLLQWKLSTE
jgi:hypothetical protein